MEYGGRVGYINAPPQPSYFHKDKIDVIGMTQGKITSSVSENKLFFKNTFRS